MRTICILFIGLVLVNIVACEDASNQPKTPPKPPSTTTVSVGQSAVHSLPRPGLLGVSGYYVDVYDFDSNKPVSCLINLPKLPGGSSEIVVYLGVPAGLSEKFQEDGGIINLTMGGKLGIWGGRADVKKLRVTHLKPHISGDLLYTTSWNLYGKYRCEPEWIQVEFSGGSESGGVTSVRVLLVTGGNK